VGSPEPLDLSPAGEARVFVRVRFFDTRVGNPGPLDVRVVANKPIGLGSVRAHLAAVTKAVPASVARAIGPHEVQLGFFPELAPSGARIERYAKNGRLQTLVTFVKPTVTFRDVNVERSETDDRPAHR